MTRAEVEKQSPYCAVILFREFVILFKIFFQIRLDALNKLLFTSFILQQMFGRFQSIVLQGQLIIQCFANEVQLITFLNH
jgi:hypothetical protein